MVRAFAPSSPVMKRHMQLYETQVLEEMRKTYPLFTWELWCNVSNELKLKSSVHCQKLREKMPRMRAHILDGSYVDIDDVSILGWHVRNGQYHFKTVQVAHPLTASIDIAT